MRTVCRTIAALLTAFPPVAAAAPPTPGVVAAHAALTAPPQRELDRGHAGPVVACVFAPDAGTLLTAGADAAVVRWIVPDGSPADPVRLRLGAGSAFPAHPAGAAFTPDGRRLVAAVRDGSVAAFDPQSGAELAAAAFPDDVQPNGDVRVAVSADGRTAAAAFPTWAGNTTGLGLVAAGLGPADRPAASRVFTGPGRQRWSSQSAATLTPDGKTAVVTRVSRLARIVRCEVVAVSAADGAVLAQISFPYANFALAAAAAPDNRSVAVTGPDGRLVLWDVVTGRPRILLDATPAGYAPPVFAADGRTVAVLTGTGYDGRTRYEDYRIRVLEVATGGVRYELNPGGIYVTALAVAPDGTAVAAGLRDKETAALVWDLAPAAGPWPWAKCGSDPDRLWSHLATGTAAQAWPAMRELIARPDVAVRLIRERVKPAPAPPAPTPAAVAGLVKQLDAPAFAARSAAEKALRDLGPLVRDDLKAALTATKSAEARDQIEGLLDRLARPPAVTRAEARAVEVLERVGTPAAKALLAAYAAGAGHTALTIDAKTSLARLGKKGP
jgi:hypothetical protein